MKYTCGCAAIVTGALCILLMFVPGGTSALGICGLVIIGIGIILVVREKKANDKAEELDRERRKWIDELVDNGCQEVRNFASYMSGFINTNKANLHCGYFPLCQYK